MAPPRAPALFILGFLFFFSLASAPALELEVQGGLGNLSFDQSRRSSLSAQGGTFDAALSPLFLLRVSHNQGGLLHNLGFQRNPITGNRLSYTLKTDLEYLSLELGPFLGLFNTPERTMNPGASGDLSLRLPGIIFTRGALSSTFSQIDNKRIGDYSQFSSDLSLGIWVPHVVASMNLSTRRHLVRRGADLLIEDESYRVFFRGQVFEEGQPYRMVLDLGYQRLSRIYTQALCELVDETETDAFKSYFIGLEGTFRLRPAFYLILGAELPLYSWGSRPLQDPPRGTALYRFWTGIRWTGSSEE
ncbi:MAG: hypothetical protein FWH12_05720 [Treponema sp.]|nr:hypothetical protein [Treponema sp.]